MIPMLPAKAVIKVRPFLVSKFLYDVFNAVEKGIVVRFVINFSFDLASSTISGRVSETTFPSNNSTMRSEYCSAISRL